MQRSVTVVLRCSSADRKALHIDLEYILSNPRPAKTMEKGIIPERPPAMRALNRPRPLNLRRVVEFGMEEIIGGYGLQSFELYHFCGIYWR